MARLLATKCILKAARSRPRGRGTDLVERQDKEYQPGNGRCKFRVTEAATMDPTDRRMDVHVRHNAQRDSFRDGGGGDREKNETTIH